MKRNQKALKAARRDKTRPQWEANAVSVFGTNRKSAKSAALSESLVSNLESRQ